MKAVSVIGIAADATTVAAEGGQDLAAAQKPENEAPIDPHPVPGVPSPPPMPTKRDILAHLTHDELLALADRFALPVPDRRAREPLEAAVASSKKATLAEILPGYARSRLKELCRALGLDDSGKEKAPLVERLLGAGAQGELLPRASSPKASAAAPEQMAMPLGDKLTIDALERYLWSAADILRGSIDSSDYKGFIFGLLFLKRLSDRFDEECDALATAGDDPEDSNNHPFIMSLTALNQDSFPKISRTEVVSASAPHPIITLVDGKRKIANQEVSPNAYRPVKPKATFLSAGDMGRASTRAIACY